MTFTYFKVSPATAPSPACPGRCGTSGNLLAHRGRYGRRRIDGDRWQGPVLTAAGSAWSPGAAHESAASYILQKDPDGCWYLDQWKEDAAASIRPFAAHRQDDAGASARADAELFFIIEIN